MEIFCAQKKAGDLFVPKNMPIYNRVIEKFDPKQFRILAIALGEKRPIPRFSSSVDISCLTIRKTALETVLFDQRPRQRLR
ncbi:MAG: hypothetical protein GX421_11450 [Caldisericales bacterium]|nr:hypothetical protein [Caldisericales bacterium]